jgi:hypothetical protein
MWIDEFAAAAKPFPLSAKKEYGKLEKDLDINNWKNGHSLPFCLVIS